MKINLNICKYLLLWVLLGVTSCIMDNGTCPDEPDSGKENWITLQFIVSEESPVTRANPASGEEGNGREEEICNEATIHDVNIFLFADNSSLLNAASNTTLTHLYFNLDDPGDRENTLSFTKEISPEDNKTVYTVTFLDEVPGIVLPLRSRGTVRFITVANIGRSMHDELAKEDASGNKKEIQLSDLWDYDLLSTTWSGTGQNVSDGYDRFVMTTAYDETNTESFITFSNESGAGTESSPFRGKTTLQRMCARIDVMYADNNLKALNDKSELKYAAGENGHTVHITNMLPVNVMSSPSFLFKKVSNGIPTDWSNVNGRTWGGKESKHDDGVPSNYVLEPNTLKKENLEGNELNDALVNWYGDTKTSSVKYFIQDTSKGQVGGYHHYDYTTQYSDTKTYSKIAVLGYANENTQSPNQFNSNYLTGIAFRAIYMPNEIRPSATENAVQPTKIYRYSPSKDGVVDESESLYFSDKAALQAYQSEHMEDMAVVTEYDAVMHGGKLGFACYYNLWLKHYDDVDDIKSDPHKVYPMQYATVRNNIYRVALKFNGPGDPEPTMREPETMQARIFVRKWNQRMENNALQF
ncbi:MAG: fimbria major subunit [Muribaculaceae bacterium]|nr:fimbria major subunit [Muribaculaceae bacterium]